MIAVTITAMALRAELAAVFAAAVRACDPAARVTAVLAARPRPGCGAVTLVAIGKAAVAMARGAVEAWGDAIGGGLVVHPDGVAIPAALARLDVRAAAHPVPDARSEAAGRAALACAAAVPADGLLLVLISGGASALAAVPAAGLTLDDKRGEVAALVARGAPIAALNAARTAQSAIKGGRLAAACRGRVLTLVVSDVPGDDVAIVGSGPTVPARAGDEVVLVAGLGALRDAAVAACPGPATIHEAVLVGDVAEVDAIVRAAAARLAPGAWWIGGGEWTVALGATRGEGGRASELALRAAAWLDGGDAVVLVGASDGVDGTGPGAGAIVDGGTRARVGDVAAALARHDSGGALAATGDALVIGPGGAMSRVGAPSGHDPTGEGLATGPLERGGPTGINHADLVLIARPPVVRGGA